MVRLVSKGHPKFYFYIILFFLKIGLQNTVEINPSQIIVASIAISKVPLPPLGSGSCKYQNRFGIKFASFFYRLHKHKLKAPMINR